MMKNTCCSIPATLPIGQRWSCPLTPSLVTAYSLRGHFVKTVAMRIQEGFERRASIKALFELDDRLLRDIGIERYTLEATVDGILKGGHAVSSRPMATVHPLVTPETGKDEETLRPAA